VARALSGPRERNRKRRALTRDALDADVAAVRLDDGADEAEAKAQTPLTAAEVAAEESIVMCALSGSSAPRQRRGRNGLIGVSASRGALIGMIGPCTDKL